MVGRAATARRSRDGAIAGRRRIRTACVATALGCLSAACVGGSGQDARRDLAPTSTEIDANALVERAQIGGGASARLAMSPERDAVAFSVIRARIATNDYEIDWRVLELAGDAPPRVVGDGGDLMLNIRQEPVTGGAVIGAAAKWSPDGAWIAYPKSLNGEIQIWRARRDGRVEEQVTRNDADVLGDLAYQALFEWSADGSKIFYEVARTRAAMADAMAEEGRRGFLFDERFAPAYGPLPRWTRCGGERRGERPTESQACEPTLWTHDLATGAERLATDAEREEYDRIRADAADDFRAVSNGGAIARRSMGRADDGSEIWLENVDPSVYAGHTPPMRLMARTPNGETHACGATACASQFISAAWKLGDAVVFLRRTGADDLETVGHWAFYSWSLDTGATDLILKSAARFSECAPAHGALVCFMEEPTRPRRLVSLDVSSGAARDLFDPNPQFRPGAFTRVEHVERRTAEGLATYGELVYPKDYVAGRAYPLIWVEGPDGFLSGGAGDEYPIHLFAQEGFFVFRGKPYADYDLYARLQGRALSRAEFETFLLRRWALAAYRDVIGDLVARGLVDPARVAVTGLSSGSVNARYALIHSDVFAAAAFSTGYSGPQRYWATPSRDIRRWLRETYVDGALPFEPEAEAFYAEEQLGWRTRETRFPPVLWQVSDDELSHALFDHALLEDEGHPVEMVVFPGEHHVKHQPVHRFNVYLRNLQWMRFWLKGETARDPVDPAQYDRWAGLCTAYVDGLRASERAADHARAERQPCLAAGAPPG